MAANLDFWFLPDGERIRSAYLSNALAMTMRWTSLVPS